MIKIKKGVKIGIKQMCDYAFEDIFQFSSDRHT